MTLPPSGAQRHRRIYRRRASGSLSVEPVTSSGSGTFYRGTVQPAVAVLGAIHERCRGTDGGGRLRGFVVGVVVDGEGVDAGGASATLELQLLIAITPKRSSVRSL